MIKFHEALLNHTNTYNLTGKIEVLTFYLRWASEVLGVELSLSSAYQDVKEMLPNLIAVGFIFPEYSKVNYSLEDYP